MNISGNGVRRKLQILWEKSKQDLENYRIVDGKLETTDRSRWLEDNEKMFWDTNTGEVIIKNV